eukprot:1150117-Prymnesium_polylepis.2
MRRRSGGRGSMGCGRHGEGSTQKPKEVGVPGKSVVHGKPCMTGRSWRAAQRQGGVTSHDKLPGQRTTPHKDPE